MPLQYWESRINYQHFKYVNSSLNKFEQKHEKLAPISVFVRRVAAPVMMAGNLIAVALLIGIIGYHWLGI
jgi:hypothetical protein